MSRGVVKQLVRMSAGRFGVKGRVSWLSQAEKIIKLSELLFNDCKEAEAEGSSSFTLFTDESAVPVSLVDE